MKIKTAELEGAALNWAVRKCTLGRNPIDYVEARDNFSTSWNKGGPIIEWEKINLASPNPTEAQWTAMNWFAAYKHDGPTPLIAAMRCYVASWLGDEVEVPDGLA